MGLKRRSANRCSYPPPYFGAGAISQIKIIKKDPVMSTGKKVLCSFCLSMRPIILSFSPIYKHTGLGLNTSQQMNVRSARLCLRTMTQDIKNSYKGNRFLAEQDRQALEDKTDPYWHNVYTTGNRGVFGDIVLINRKYSKLYLFVLAINRIYNGFNFRYNQNPNTLT